MEHLLSLIGAPANALTLIIAIGILIIMLTERGLLGLRIGKRETLSKRMDTLVEYVNHRETEKIDRLIEIGEETRQVMKELKEYGIRCRDK